jgi:hypothetical protein
MDRMAIWMRNVERMLIVWQTFHLPDNFSDIAEVVEDARQNFASSSREITPLPPLPLAPLSRATSQTYRSSRLPRKVLAASQIFADPADESQNMSSLDAAATSTVANADLSEGTSQTLTRPRTPTRQRRATVSARSPEPADASFDIEMETGSPSKRKEKSRSHADLLERRITPVAQLELEIAKRKSVLQFCFQII